MRHAIKTWMFVTAVIATLFTACEKEDMPSRPPQPVPGSPGQPTQPGKTPDVVITNLRVKVAVKIGEVVYDSIPATLHIASFDSAGQVTNQVVELEAGTNTLALYGKHAKYTLKMTKWGLSDQVTVTRAELATKGVIQLGASKAAKRLKSEANFFVTSVGTRPKDVTEYRYDGAGRVIRAIYHEQRLDIDQMDFKWVDKYIYEGGKLDRIERFDAFVDTSMVPASFTAFNYDAQGRIAQIYNNQVRETAIQLTYNKEGVHDVTRMYYFFKEADGTTHDMNYSMKFLGGNKVEESARIYSGTRAGTFSYDFNINPYIHMNVVDLYLSNSSKNNTVGVNRGSITDNDPYRFEYLYDMDGYPQQLLRSYKASGSGEHRYSIQTMFTYY